VAPPVVAGEWGSWGGTGAFDRTPSRSCPQALRLTPRVPGTTLMACLHKGQLFPRAAPLSPSITSGPSWFLKCTLHNTIVGRKEGCYPSLDPPVRWIALLLLNLLFTTYLFISTLLTCFCFHTHLSMYVPFCDTKLYVSVPGSLHDNFPLFFILYTLCFFLIFPMKRSQGHPLGF
jgi:hypothetical protein